LIADAVAVLVGLALTVNYLHRRFQRRLRGYRAIGYARGEWPRGGVKASDRLIVAYDVEADTETNFG